MKTKHKFSQPIANWKSRGITLGIYETLKDYYILTIWEHAEKVQIYHYPTRAQAKAMFNKMIFELLETL